MVGAGIFTLSGELAGAAGPAVVVTYALAGLVALGQAVAFAELAAARPGSGGPYVYVRDFVGARAAALVGWQLWSATALSASFYAVGFARYLRQLGPSLPEGLAAAGCLGVLAALTARTHKAAATWLQNLAVLLLLAVLGGLVALGWRARDPALWVPFAPHGWWPAVQGVPIAFVSFLGFDTVAQAGGVFRSPQRTVPRATLASVAAVTALYCGVVAVGTGVVHYRDLGSSAAPLADVADRLAGRIGRLAVVLAGLVATLSSANGALVAAGELAGAMARDRRAARPPAAAISPEALTALLAMAGVAGAAAGGGLGWLARGAGLMHVLPLLAMPYAQARARRRLGASLPFRVPGGPLWPALSGLGVLWILRHVSWQELAAGLVLTLPALAAALRRPPAAPPGPPPGQPAWPAPGRPAPSSAQKPGRPGKGA